MLPVHIVKPNGDSISLKVGQNRTVEAIKRKIGAMTELTSEQPNLHALDQEEPLRDNQTIRSLLPSHGTSIELFMTVNEQRPLDPRKALIKSYPRRRRETKKLIKQIKAAGNQTEKRSLQERLKKLKSDTKRQWEEATAKPSTEDDLDDLL